jgi:uncharacterized membrane protein YkoI
MNRFTRMFLAAGCLVAMTVITAAARGNAAPGKPAAKGSIRPVGKVKPADCPALAKISFESALQAARARTPGSVIKAELEVEDGCLMYPFEIVGADKSITEVEIDAGNGRVLGTENATNDKD